MPDESTTPPEDWSPRLRSVRVLAGTDGPAAALTALERCITTDLSTKPPLECLLLRGELLLGAGQYDPGLEQARSLRSEFPEHPDVLSLFLDALELSGLHVEALETVESAPASAGVAHRAHGLRQFAIPAMRLAAQAADAGPRIEAAASLEPSNEPARCDKENGLLAAHLLRVFSGHPRAFARQVRLAGNKGFGYVPVRRPLERADVEAHLAGRDTLGIYFLDPAGGTRLACWDLDIGARVLASAAGDPATLAALKQRARDETRRLLDLAAARGLPLALEDSGSKGYHLWLFCETVPASELRLLGEWVRRRLGAPPSPLSWEFFPKQDIPGPRGLGNLVKLPLGVHRASGRRSLFLDPSSFEPLADQAQYALSLRRMPARQVARLIGEIALESAASAPMGAVRRPRLPRNGDEDSTDGPLSVETQFPDESETASEPPLGAVSASMPSLGPAAAVTLELPRSLPGPAGRVLAGCGVLAALVGKARAGQPLTPRERHVLLHICSPLGESGRLLAHQLLSQFPGYDPDIVHRGLRGVSPTVMGCARIAGHVPHLATASVCRCRFALPPRGYASPVVHAGLLPKSEQLLPEEGALEETTGSLEGVLLRQMAREQDPAKLTALRDALQEWKRLLEAEMPRQGPSHPRLRLVRAAAVGSSVGADGTAVSECSSEEETGEE